MKSFSIKFLIYAVGILLFSGMLAACADDPGGKDEPENLPCERAVLVYLLADNSLGRDGFDRRNLSEMIDAASAGFFGGNRLLVYHDDCKAESPMLKEVTPDGLKTLKVYDNSQLSTSAERMSLVIEDFKELTAADRYGLIFWSHATGWPFAKKSDQPGGASPLWVGEDKSNYMDVTDLHEVLCGKGFDYIYFDCCHMASVEALYEIRDVADFFVASAAELPAEGMPYYDALPYLITKDANLVDAARATFMKYDALTGSDRTITISVIKAAALEPLAQATQALYSLHPTLSPEYEGQCFERRKYNGEPCYLFDLEDYIDNLCFDQEDSTVEEWKKALDDAVVYQAATPWIFNLVRVDHHCGLTTYILRREEDAFNKGYYNLSWYRDVASGLFQTQFL